MEAKGRIREEISKSLKRQEEHNICARGGRYFENGFRAGLKTALRILGEVDR